MPKSQEKWEQAVRSFIVDWFEPSEEGIVQASDVWEDICGRGGSGLESVLTLRDIRQVLLCCYRLVALGCKSAGMPDPRAIDRSDLQEFIEDIQRRLCVPRLEVKHIYFAEQWHDFTAKYVELLMKQDLARCNMCIEELEAAEHITPGLRWPWPSDCHRQSSD